MPNENDNAAMAAQMAAITPSVTPTLPNGEGADVLQAEVLNQMLAADPSLADVAAQEGIPVQPASEPAQQPTTPTPTPQQQPQQPATPPETAPRVPVDPTDPNAPVDIPVEDLNAILAEAQQQAPTPAPTPAPTTPAPAPAPATAPAEPGPPEGVGTRAENRFQRLANEKRQLEQQVNRLLQAQEQQARLQSEALSRSMEITEAQRQAAADARRREEWAASGFDETRFEHQMAVTSVQQAEEARRAAEAARSELDTFRREQQARAYQDDIVARVSRTLSTYEVTPEQAASFARQAVAMGYSGGMTSDKAVEAVLAPMVSLLPRKGAAPAPKPAELPVPPAVAAGMAVPASGSGRPGGTPAVAGGPPRGQFVPGLTIEQNMARLPGFAGVMRELEEG